MTMACVRVFYARIGNIITPNNGGNLFPLIFSSFPFLFPCLYPAAGGWRIQIFLFLCNSFSILLQQWRAGVSFQVCECLLRAVLKASAYTSIATLKIFCNSFIILLQWWRAGVFSSLRMSSMSSLDCLRICLHRNTKFLFYLVKFPGEISFSRAL